MISILSPCVVVRSAFSCSCFSGVQAPGVQRLFFHISHFRTFSFFRLSWIFVLHFSCFRGFGFHGLRAFGLRVFVIWMLVLPACKLSGFLPFMFSSFRLSFFDISPELSIVCSKFAFVSCVSLLFAVLLGCFWKFQTTVFTRATTIFTCATTIFPMPTTIFEIAPFMCASVDVCCPELF